MANVMDGLQLGCNWFYLVFPWIFIFVEGSDLAQAFQARQCRSHAPVWQRVRAGPLCNSWSCWRRHPGCHWRWCFPWPWPQLAEASAKLEKSCQRVLHRFAWQTGLHTGIATPLTEMMEHGHHPTGLCSHKKICWMLTPLCQQACPSSGPKGTQSPSETFKSALRQHWLGRPGNCSWWPSCSWLLKDVCYYAMWRKALGRHSGEHCPFTATGTSIAGGALPRLGADLATATFSLVAGGRQYNVHRRPKSWPFLH